MYHLSIHKPFILAVFPVSHPINLYTKKVYTPHTGNSTKINPVNQIITAYTFLGITGVNGVMRGSSGEYKAYICFQRKQITFGSSANFEDTVAIRKITKEEFYGKIQHDNADWEQRLADAMAEHKKNKK